MRYRRKPIEVEAVMWTGVNIDEIKSFINDDVTLAEVGGDLKIMSFDGYLTAHRGDYLIRNKREIYPCNIHSFLEIYEEI